MRDLATQAIVAAETDLSDQKIPASWATKVEGLMGKTVLTERTFLNGIQSAFRS